MSDGPVRSEWAVEAFEVIAGPDNGFLGYGVRVSLFDEVVWQESFVPWDTEEGAIAAGNGFVAGTQAEALAREFELAINAIEGLRMEVEKGREYRVDAERYRALRDIEPGDNHGPLQCIVWTEQTDDGEVQLQAFSTPGEDDIPVLLDDYADMRREAMGNEKTSSHPGEL